ncbi:MAG TPA: BatA domain-containing protein [Vicinamibacterales bacterium]|nr:BatA domain-containing protein [Vicinamibacterales bacterium]
MMGLAFLSPWFLLGALAVALPVLLHLRKQDIAPAHPFAAIRFLRRAPVEARRPRQLRDLLLLALRVAALALLAAAFARPYVRGEDAVGGITIVAVDTSFSMGAPGRMAKAKDAALRAIAAAPAGDRLALIRVDDRAVVLAEPSLDRGAARAALASLTAGSGGTSLTPLWSAATRLAGAAKGRLVLISDLEVEHAAGAIADGLTLDVVDVGGPVENLAVGPARREADALVAEVTNHGIRPRKTQVVLTVNDRSVADAAVAIEPGRTASVRLPARLPSSGVARIAITDSDGIPADDTRYLVLDAPPLATVALLGEQADGDDLFLLRSAIESGGPDRGFAPEMLGGDARRALGAETARARQVIVVSGTRGLTRETRRVLHDYAWNGGALWLLASDTLDAGTLGEIVGNSGLHIEAADDGAFPTTLSPVDTRHPIFAAFGDAAAGLGRARFTRALRVVPGPGGRVVARFTNGLAALVEQPVGTGRIAVFASALGSEDATAWNTFARQAAFVPFVLETLHYLAGPAARALPADLVVADAPEGARGRPGIVRAGHPPRPVAVNVDLRESGATRVKPEAIVAAVGHVEPERRGPSAVAREREAGQGLWWYVLVGVAGLLVWEAIAGSRRLATAPREETVA